jgi:CBS domain-containing protein
MEAMANAWLHCHVLAASEEQ